MVTKQSDFEMRENRPVENGISPGYLTKPKTEVNGLLNASYSKLGVSYLRSKCKLYMKVTKQRICVSDHLPLLELMSDKPHLRLLCFPKSY